MYCFDYCCQTFLITIRMASILHCDRTAVSLIIHFFEKKYWGKKFKNKCKNNNLIKLTTRSRAARSTGDGLRPPSLWSSIKSSAPRFKSRPCSGPPTPPPQSSIFLLPSSFSSFHDRCFAKVKERNPFLRVSSTRPVLPQPHRPLRLLLSLLQLLRLQLLGPVHPRMRRRRQGQQGQRWLRLRRDVVVVRDVPAAVVRLRRVQWVCWFSSSVSTRYADRRSLPPSFPPLPAPPTPSLTSGE